jgi:hypothetical protein
MAGAAAPSSSGRLPKPQAAPALATPVAGTDGEGAVAHHDRGLRCRGGRNHTVGGHIGLDIRHGIEFGACMAAKRGGRPKDSSTSTRGSALPAPPQAATTNVCAVSRSTDTSWLTPFSTMVTPNRRFMRDMVIG